jgi:hypothetical protein
MESAVAAIRNTQMGLVKNRNGLPWNMDMLCKKASSPMGPRMIAITAGEFSSIDR